MKNTFEITDLGLLSYFLGLEVKQGQNSIFITQKKYIQDLLEAYNMQGCKTVATPLNNNEKLRFEDGSEEIEAKTFKWLVEKLMYIAHTCLDITIKTPSRS